MRTNHLTLKQIKQILFQCKYLQLSRQLLVLPKAQEDKNKVNNTTKHGVVIYVKSKTSLQHYPQILCYHIVRARRDHDHMVVRLSTTCAISAYHH